MILSFNDLGIAFLIFARVAGLFVFAPVYNTRSIPAGIKTVLAIWITIVLWYVVPTPYPPPSGAIAFIAALVTEVAIGTLLGFLCQFLFIAVQSAGEVIDLQMGLSVATTFDPVFGSTVSIVGRLTFFLALSLFLIFNGHHLILEGLAQSFRALPIGGGFHLPPPTFELFLELGTTFWFITIKLAAPAVMLIFLSDFAFGIVSRVAPQVNVFMLGFQVKPSLGLLGILFSLSFFVKHIEALSLSIYEEMLKFLHFMK